MASLTRRIVQRGLEMGRRRRSIWNLVCTYKSSPFKTRRDLESMYQLHVARSGLSLQLDNLLFLWPITYYYMTWFHFISNQWEWAGLLKSFENNTQKIKCWRKVSSHEKAPCLGIITFLTTYRAMPLMYKDWHTYYIPIARRTDSLAFYSTRPWPATDA